MKRLGALLPTLVTLGAIVALALHGRILQFPDYNQFADRASLLGVPCARNVLSNLGFALVGLFGLWRLAPRRHAPSLRRGWPGYALFLAGVTLTAFGSAYYHLAPDNARLLFDRLPIALACAGLLAAVRAESRPTADARRDAILLALVAVGSVLWWHLTDRPPGAGDLRPYVLLQGLPLLLIPLWQWSTPAARADRLCFAAALVLYVLAKAAELNDRELFAALGVLSGHTLKHLLAALAAAVIVVRLDRRGHRVSPPGLACIRKLGGVACRASAGRSSASRDTRNSTRNSALGDTFMIRISRVLCALGAFLSLAALASVAYADGRDYNDGAVMNVSFIRTVDGHFDDYMHWLATTYKKQQEAAKAAGLITRYQVIVGQPHTPQDADVILIVEYKNWAALDHLGGKLDQVSAKIEGSVEKANQSEVERSKIRTVLGSDTMQVAELK